MSHYIYNIINMKEFFFWKVKKETKNGKRIYNP
jgi:hypothetical protein